MCDRFGSHADDRHWNRDIFNAGVEALLLDVSVSQIAVSLSAQCWVDVWKRPLTASILTKT